MPGRRDNRALTGKMAETAACAYLERRGLRCIEKNFRCRFGEIDLVMRTEEIIVFVEVRFRRATNPVSSLVSVDYRKQMKLARTAAWYLGQKSATGGEAVRFDVVAVDGRSHGDYALQWVRDAFRPGA